MPSKNSKIQKALKDGVISKKQFDALPDALLLGIVKKKGEKKGTTKKGNARKGQPKGARLAYDDTKDERKKKGK